MKGLLYKDLILIWRDSRNMLVLCVLFLLLGVITSNYFFSVITIIYVAMLPLTTMGIDEVAKWDRYAITMPVTRWELVASRYLLALFGMVFTAACFLLLSYVIAVFKGSSWGLQDNMINLLMVLCIASLFLALNFPICFKVGVAKSRMWYLALIALFFVVIFGAMYLDIIDYHRLVNLISSYPLWLLPLACLGIYLASYFISLGFYKSREL